MPGLETAFYIVGLVFMGLSLILLIALLVAILAIRAKIHSMQRNIANTIERATSIAGSALSIFGIVRRFRRRSL